jgi:hypothetical protein
MLSKMEIVSVLSQCTFNIELKRVVTSYRGMPWVLRCLFRGPHREFGRVLQQVRAWLYATRIYTLIVRVAPTRYAYIEIGKTISNCSECAS